MMLRRSMAAPRGSAFAAAAIVVAASLVVAPAGQAAAYRYWTYWSGSGAGWTFSQVGPASSVPRDGGVEGWRFAVSTGVRGQDAEPRLPAGEAFDRFCGDVGPKAGMKRVAVVFDFGDSADAPPGQTAPQARGTCAQVPKGHTGGQVLQQVADFRVEGGLVCAIAGYPAGECAPAVADPASPTAASPTAAESPKPARRTPGASRSPRGAASSPAVPQEKRRGVGQESLDSGTSGGPRRAAAATGTSPSSASPPASAGKAPTPNTRSGSGETPRGAKTDGGREDADRPEATPSGSASAVGTSAPAPSATESQPTFIAEQARSEEQATAPGAWSLLALALLLGLGGWAISRFARSR